VSLLQRLFKLHRKGSTSTLKSTGPRKLRKLKQITTKCLWVNTWMTSPNFGQRPWYT